MAATMTRQHFRAIAETLRGLRPEWPQDGQAACDRWSDAVRCFADLCSASNPRFSRERFYAAAGVEEPRA